MMVAHLAAAFWMGQAADPRNAFTCARANEDEIGTFLCHCSSSLQLSVSYLSRNNLSSSFPLLQKLVSTKSLNDNQNVH